jgi:uncharacterized protein (DUF362 family)
MVAHAHGHRGSRFFDGFLGRWFLANSVLSGILAVLWIVLRTGAKPSRLAYPCQRAAVSTATVAFGTPFVAAVIAARRRMTLWARTPVILAVAAVGLAMTLSLSIYFSRAVEYSGPVLDPPRDYRAQLYHVTGCPQDPGGDHFVGVSNLLGVMGCGGLKFYDSATVSPVAGPEGIIATDDIVVIKINYQWDQRGGTNTDLLRGLIRAVVDHPDGFTGEVVVCENAQFNSTSGFDRALNNAQDHGLSPRDVVVGFQGQGYRVSHYDWTVKRTVQVNEYSTGDMTDGYLVESYNAGYQGKLSYPKFRSTNGTYISIRYGIWNPGGGTYDRSRLKFINVPVLKSHHATYGATVCTKHYMGVVTDQFSTNSHSGIRLGIMGALMGEIQMADLNIVDAIWINANPNSGPSTSYSGATRRDELVAGLDPIAIDRWSVKNILIPAFLANGYSPPWPSPSADPDLPSGAFRTYLDNSMNQLLAVGRLVTNDYAQMDVLNGNGAAGDFDANGAVDMVDYDRFTACFTGPGGGPVGPECAAGDFDGDGDVDCDDWSRFGFVWTSMQALPELPACAATEVSDSGSAGIGAALAPPVPNPMGTTTEISYSITVPGHVTVAIFDVGGHLVRTLVDRSEGPGDHSVSWDGRNDGGEQVGHGIFLCRLDAAGSRSSRKIVIP